MTLLIDGLSTINPKKGKTEFVISRKNPKIEVNGNDIKHYKYGVNLHDLILKDQALSEHVQTSSRMK